MVNDMEKTTYVVYYESDESPSGLMFEEFEALDEDDAMSQALNYDYNRNWTSAEFVEEDL